MPRMIKLFLFIGALVFLLPQTTKAQTAILLYHQGENGNTQSSIATSTNYVHKKIGSFIAPYTFIASSSNFFATFTAKEDSCSAAPCLEFFVSSSTDTVIYNFDGQTVTHVATVNSTTLTGDYTTFTDRQQVPADPNFTFIGGETYGIYATYTSNQNYTIQTGTSNTLYGSLSVFGSSTQELTSGNTRILEQRSPEHLETTPTNIVFFDFDYWYNDTQSYPYYDQVCIRITNTTDGLNMIPTCFEIIASGQTTIQTTIPLDTGKEYFYRPSIQNSEGNIAYPPIFGQPVIFYVESVPVGNDITLLPEIPEDEEDGGNLAEISIRKLINTGFSILTDRYPFNWIYGIYTDFTSISSTTASTTMPFEPATIDFGVMNLSIYEHLPEEFSTSTTDLEIELFSPANLEEVGEMDVIQFARGLASAFLWITFIGVIIREVFAIFAPKQNET